MRRVDHFEKKFAQRVFDLVGVASHILDLPCGSGRFLSVFSRAKRLTMIDLSPEMLEAGREKATGRDNVRFAIGDVRSIPLSDGAANLTFTMRLFHHLPSDDFRLTALKELARVSKSYVALSFYNRNAWRYYWRWILGKKIRGHHITYSHMVWLAKKAGLTPVERWPKRTGCEQQCLAIFQKSSTETSDFPLQPNK
jgi:ubiquinone/menaquinone biosynthesis C-methylase UbiE